MDLVTASSAIDLSSMAGTRASLSKETGAVIGLGTG